MQFRSFGLAIFITVSGCLWSESGSSRCPQLDLAGAAQPLRDPTTGVCVEGPNPCDGVCGPCAAAQPDWGPCGSSCDALDEGNCIATAGCRAAYTTDTSTFKGCWAVAQSGPTQGSCTDLDAYTCSRHDDCAAVYTAGEPAFARCISEPVGVPLGCYGDDTCGADKHCTVSDGECLPPPGCDPPPANGGCPAVCFGHCVADTPGA